MALSKYYLNKRVVPVIHEALEVHGGAGYIEDCILPRAYREAPVNGIWEGAGNVISLDVLRALRKTPLSGEVFLAELRGVRGADARMDALTADLEQMILNEPLAEENARYLVERMAVALQAACLIRHAPAAHADAFCATRVAQGGGRAFGTLPAGTNFAGIIGRAAPAA